MKKIGLNWTLCHTPNLLTEPVDKIPASVPGAVQLDYAKEFNYAPYHYGMNFKQFDWMENEYFIYESTLDFSCSAFECALLVFEGIDYKYEIEIAGRLCAKGEGAFTPVKIDVSAYAGKKTPIKVTVFPIPKEFPMPPKRHQARSSCKPASSYGWDWHPRLVPSGIWGEANIEIFPLGSPRNLEVSYRLSDDMREATVVAEVDVYGMGEFTASLIDPNGNEIACEKREVGEKQTEKFILKASSPLLWYPREYGEQPIYTVRISGNDKVERKIGFRRTKLIFNEGCNIFEAGWPKGPRPAPMQLEINGIKVFAKGSNWVNTEIFPCLATKERYDELISLAVNANMNIFRMWGGQYINHECFYEKCDEAGIMIWQEFMLSCNLHPDSDSYLSVLKQEASTIIKRLRTHPCLVLWCGGNELFNSWSGMNEQSHPLRLLDSLCYELDRFTPFNMTSPLRGIAHGSYVKAQFPDEERKVGNLSHGEEFICAIKRSRSTAYTEFGCNSAATKEYILKYIMDKESYLNCSPDNEIWVAHHGFKSWNETTWLGFPEVIYFFGYYDDMDDFIEKSIYLQDLCYKSMFEEMRRQAPLCSMAINWDFNEPWPCAAGNSLVSWPAEPKSALNSVAQALRPALLSLEAPKNRYLTDEQFCANVWFLNDTFKNTPDSTATIYLIQNGEKTALKTISIEPVKAKTNKKLESISFTVTDELSEKFSIEIQCHENPHISSTYNFVHNKIAKLSNDVTCPNGNSDDFSYF